MNNNNIESKITGDTNSIARRKHIWKKIISSYEEGGSNKIKSTLIKYGDNLTKKFDKQLDLLEEKL
jgi:hypothetical protein